MEMSEVVGKVEPGKERMSFWNISNSLPQTICDRTRNMGPELSDLLIRQEMPVVWLLSKIYWFLNIGTNLNFLIKHYPHSSSLSHSFYPELPE